MSIYEEKEYKKKFDRGLWKRLLRYILPYKKLMAILVVLMAILAGIDVAFPLLSKYAIDNFVIPETTDGIMGFIIFYISLVVIQAFNVWIFIAVAGKIDMGICYDIRKDGFHRLQELSFSYYDRTPIGWMMARMTSDTSRLADVIAWGLVDLVWGATMMLAIIIIMLFLNWKLALITMSVIPILVVLSIYFQQKILKSYRKVRKTNSRITGAFNEGITGAKTTKTLVREEENLKEFQGLTGTMYSSSVRAAVFSSLYLPVVLTLGSIGTGLAIWLGGRGVILQALSYGTLVAFISYTVQFFEPMREMARIFAELQNAQASAERILSMIDEQPEVQDHSEVAHKFGDILKPRLENWPTMTGQISFRNVTFAYNGGEKVLDNFNLDVQAGENIALVGETGSGKSTIVNLACRFYEPTEGEILIDGVEYRQNSLLWLHSNLGYVLQAPHLFSGTIRDNIRYGKLDAEEEDIIRAAKLVNAHDFIMKLENGYDTEVGEGGGMLSTGEKQLVSFARAILADPRLFVLDEATSSVDTETEKLIQNAIQKVLEGRTSFIIAHRLSTIRSADRILVIKNGEITEQGNHQQLMELGGYYHRLYTNQFRDESEVELLRA